MYKPSALRSYEEALRRRILPALGGARLHEIRRRDLQALVDRLVGQGLSASSVRNSLMPVRVLYREAMARDEVATNPTEGLRLPSVRSVRDRIASPDEAAVLIAAVPERDRALWATAFYAGLRRGELLALRWEDVDLERGRIQVVRSWDVRAGPVSPKSAAGTRTVPVPRILQAHLRTALLRSGSRSGLCFSSSDEPVAPSGVAKRARRAWERDELNPISLHEARHTYASLMIAAGVNAKALSSYMGHASITITFDRYGHLFPGNESEAAGLLDRYLARSAAASEPKTVTPKIRKRGQRTDQSWLRGLTSPSPRAEPERERGNWL
jgi:integrase